MSSTPGRVFAGWEEIYMLCGKETSFATAVAGFDFTTTSAYGSGQSLVTSAAQFALPVTNRPDFEIGLEVDNTPKMSGKAELVSDGPIDGGLILGIAPKTSFEYPANAYNVVVPLWALFQRYTTEATTPFMKTFATSAGGTITEPADPMMYVSLARYLNTGAGANNEIIDGAVCDSLAFSCNEGPLTVSASFVGSRYRAMVDLSGTLGTGTDVVNNPLMYQNMIVKMVDSSGATPVAVNCGGFDLTISRNVTTKRYDNALIAKVIMGKISASGTLKIPLAQTGIEVSGSDYRGGIQPLMDYLGLTSSGDTYDGTAPGLSANNYKQTLVRIQVYWGSDPEAPVAGELSFDLRVFFGDIKQVTDQEPMWEIPFTCYRTGSTSGCTVRVCNGFSMAI